MKIKNIFLLLFFFLIQYSLLVGQRPFSIEISNLIEPIQSLNATFGPCIQSEISDSIINVEPALGCSAINNDSEIYGKIALIKRGDCQFTTKVKNAQQAGAIAVIVCNNRPITSHQGGLIPMGFDEGDEVGIKIPSFFISQEDCQLLSTPIHGTIRGIPYPTNSTRVTIWGNLEGQGDFSGGLNDWTVNTVSCDSTPSNVSTWEWEQDGRADKGLLSRGTSPGPTYCNGAMVFDSDFLDNNGNVEINEATGQITFIDTGSGECPAPQVGQLISPLIELNGSLYDSVFLDFYQELRNFESNYLVEYSINENSDFIQIPINTNIDRNESVEKQLISVPLLNTSNAKKIRIRFTHIANYYFWIIDDIKIRGIKSKKVSLEDPCDCSDILNKKDNTGETTFFHDVLTINGLVGSSVILTNGNNNFLDQNLNQIQNGSSLGSINSEGNLKFDFFHMPNSNRYIDLSIDGIILPSFEISACSSNNCLVEVEIGPIPTFNQWGTLIFSLLIINMSLVLIGKIETL